MKQIDIIGIGIKGFNQITLEAIESIKNADKVFHLTLHQSEIEKINPNCESLVHKYVSSNSFGIYDEFVVQIFDALKEVDRIGVINYGHPSYLVNVTQSLIQKAITQNIKYNVIPGVSSIGAMWAILNKDSGFPGSQIIEANELVRNQLTINTKLDLFLAHATEFMLPFDRNLKVKDYPEGIKTLKDYLLKYYSPEQEVAFIAISPIPQTKDKMIVVEIKDLDKEENLASYLRGMTVFIQGITN